MKRGQGDRREERRKGTHVKTSFKETSLYAVMGVTQKFFNTVVFSWSAFSWLVQKLPPIAIMSDALK